MGWTIKGPFSGKYGNFYIYNDDGLDKGVVIGEKHILNPKAKSINEAISIKGLKKIGINPEAVYTNSLKENEKQIQELMKAVKVLQQEVKELKEKI